MRRALYSLLIYILQPWALLHLWLRGRRQPEYRSHIGERYGFYPSPAHTAPCFWLHAVSVGETRAAEPLIAALFARYPGCHILLTHMTPTGRATQSALLDQCERRYLPYDMTSAVQRFLNHYQPQFGLLMETELWPNLIAACHARGVPLLLANARLSDKSFRAYQRFAALTRVALEQLHAVLAQSEADAARLRALGAPSVDVIGNVKFDFAPAAEKLGLGHNWRQQIARPIVLAASTREGEEALLLDAWRAQQTDALLVIVPRHPQRFAEVAALVAARGFKVQSRSHGLPDAACQVWLGDSMGEMAAYYAAADIAIMGGSLLDFGSQNLIEACAAGTPVIIGPSVFNFADAAAKAIVGGAALQVGNAAAAVQQAMTLLQNPAERTAMAQHAQAFSQAHQGATQRLMARLETLASAQPALPPAG